MYWQCTLVDTRLDVSRDRLYYFVENSYDVEKQLFLQKATSQKFNRVFN